MTKTLTLFYHEEKYEIPISKTCPTTSLVTTETFELSMKFLKRETIVKQKVHFIGNIESNYAHGPGRLFTMDGILLSDVLWLKGKIIHGKMFFPDTGNLLYDGQFYPNGQFKNGKLYRKFRLFDKKLIYEGSFDIHSRFHGHGVKSSPNGNNYFGNWKNGEKHGKGVKSYHNGDTYVGNWRNSKKHGQGVYTFFDGSSYEGNWKDDEKHGKGVYTFVDGSTYDGNWKNDKKHGHGTIRNSLGYFFEGFFLQGLRQGNGIESFVIGEKYIGSYKDDKRHGQGFLQFHDMVSFNGFFKNGHICGEGTLFRKNNRIWKQGDFKGNDLHGKGIVFANNGTIQQEGKFIHGKFFDETALMVQKYLDTRDSSVLNKITVKEIQKYIGTKFETTYPVSKSKKYLLKQLIELSKPSAEEFSVEENYDEFGNEIKTKCLGNDGNIYDIESMFYLFQQNDRGEYTNIPYGYVENTRMPTFPRMGNGKLLDGYRILFDNEDLVPPTLTRNNPENSNINLISDDDSLFDEEMTEL
jgi:hypothetical protein